VFDTLSKKQRREEIMELGGFDPWKIVEYNNNFDVGSGSGGEEV
jgi:hypothetical protein